MKIIILNDYANVQGGAAQVAVKSAVSLADVGHDVVFIFGTGEIDKSLLQSKVECIGLEQYDLLSNPSKYNAALNGVWNHDVEKKVVELLKIHFDENAIVHVHSWVKSLSISALASVINSRLPHVLTLHDYFTVCPNGGFFNYKTRNSCELKPMSISCMMSDCDARNYAQKIWRVFRQLVYKKADFPASVNNFITVSDFSANILSRYLPNNSMYYRVSNPIAIPKLPRAQPSKSKMFTYIGRLSPEKGVDIILSLKNIPQENIRFVGTGELEPYLKKQLPNARFEGWCDKSQILSFLDDSRALVFPSLLYETQGLVVLEAAARGVPSVVSDITAAQEFIVNGKTGLLFESGNPIDLDNKLSRLLVKTNLADEMGECAYKSYWKSPSDISNHVNSLVGCYKEIIQKKIL